MTREEPGLTQTESDAIRRPPSVIAIGALFICVGLGAVVAGIWRTFVPAGFTAAINDSHAMTDLSLVVVSGLVAAAGGVLLLRGQRWGRWLIVFWLAAHVVISLEHDRFELVVHGLLFVVVTFMLYRRVVSAFLRTRPA